VPGFVDARPERGELSFEVVEHFVSFFCVTPEDSFLFEF